MRWMDNLVGDTFDDAINRSRQEKGHALVCWTAAWCPPCNELRLMVFDKPEFAMFGDKLVLMKLDGDGPDAQEYADRLRVRSYPTTLLMDGDGRELLRFPGGLKVQEFCRYLDLAISAFRGIAEVAKDIRLGISVSDADFELFAVHWWNVDDQLSSGSERPKLLGRAFSACPSQLADARLRLLVQFIQASAREKVSFGLKEADLLASQFEDLAATPAARYSNIYFLLPDLNVLQVLGDTARQRLENSLCQILDRLLSTSELQTTERLIVLMARLALARRLDATSVPFFIQMARSAALNADQSSDTVAERQTTINMAGHLLKSADFVDESLQMFSREIGRTPHAGYFWPYVASIHFDRQQDELGIQALRQSWQASPPGPSRITRGSTYLAKIAELRPGELQLIESEALALLRELGARKDALKGTNRSSTERILKVLARQNLKIPILKEVA